MPREIAAIFFDLDDTLCDARSAFAAGLERAFAMVLARRPGLDATMLRLSWQRTHAGLFERLESGDLTMARVRQARFRETLRGAGLEDDSLADEADWLLGETQLTRLRLFGGALETLDALRARYGVGIITNGAADEHPDSQRSKARHLGLLDHVDSFLTSDEVGARKPDPRIFALALERNGCLPCEAIYVGDSPATDMLGANRAGMYSILVRHGSEDAPDALAPDEWVPEEERPRAVVRGLREIVALVERLGASPG